jgi:hypothetical protein
MSRAERIRRAMWFGYAACAAFPLGWIGAARLGSLNPLAVAAVAAVLAMFNLARAEAP